MKVIFAFENTKLCGRLLCEKYFGQVSGNILRSLIFVLSLRKGTFPNAECFQELEDLK